MKKLKNMELTSINGGGPILDIWDDITTLVTDRIPSFWKGLKRGWASC